jgi:hypothetical protein
MGEIQKVESKLAQLKETFEKQKVDIRSLNRENQAIARTIEPKVMVEARPSLLDSAVYQCCVF